MQHGAPDKDVISCCNNGPHQRSCPVANTGPECGCLGRATDSQGKTARCKQRHTREDMGDAISPINPSINPSRIGGLQLPQQVCVLLLLDGLYIIQDLEHGSWLLGAV